MNGGELHTQGSPPGMLSDHQPRRHQQQAPDRHGGEPHPQGPPRGLARDHLLHNSQKQAPARNGGDRPRGPSARIGEEPPTPPKPAASPSREWRGTAPTGPSARNDQGPPNAAKPASGLSQEWRAGTCTGPSGRLARDHPSHHSQQQAPATNGVPVDVSRLPQQVSHLLKQYGMFQT